MNRINPLKYVWIWCRRFRHRCGYGVHSPFAFNLITWVIYEKAPFYAYRDLDKKRKSPLLKGKDTNTKKVDRLLFRLVNEVQPEKILEIGTQAGLSALYLSAAKKNAAVVTIDADEHPESVARQLLSGHEKIEYRTGDLQQSVCSYLASASHVDFVHFNSRRPQEKLWEKILPNVDVHSFVVVEGIYASREMKQWWKKLVADERTGITFDLYDLGLVFFDKTKIKQHYIVNF